MTKIDVKNTAGIPPKSYITPDNTSIAPANTPILNAEFSVQEVFTRYTSDKLFSYISVSPKVQALLKDSSVKKYIISDCDVPLSTQKIRGEALKTLNGLSNSDIKNALFHIYFTCDSDALPVLKKIKECNGSFIAHNDFAKTSYRFINRLAHTSLRKTWAKAGRLSHLLPIVHENICEALELTRNVDGDYLEIGVYIGGSALTALHYMAEAGIKRKTYLLDTFDGFNFKEAEGSPDIHWAYSHRLYGVEATKQHVAETLNDAGAAFELVENNICTDELPSDIKKIAIANIDVDLYESTVAALNKVAPLMAIGGIIIAEDPSSTPGLYGAYLAMHEFLETEMGKNFLPIFKAGQYFLLRR